MAEYRSLHVHVLCSALLKNYAYTHAMQRYACVILSGKRVLTIKYAVHVKQQQGSLHSNITLYRFSCVAAEEPSPHG